LDSWRHDPAQENFSAGDVGGDIPDDGTSEAAGDAAKNAAEPRRPASGGTFSVEPRGVGKNTCHIKPAKTRAFTTTSIKTNVPLDFFLSPLAAPRRVFDWRGAIWGARRSIEENN
jgi:hypothetical protein